MEVDRPINLAIMGIGTIGKRHLMAIEEIDTVNVCGVVDLSEEAKSYCKNHKIPIFHNLNELKKNQNVDKMSNQNQMTISSISTHPNYNSRKIKKNT